MKKDKGLANRIAAMLLSGILVIGTVPGIALASETRADPGVTSENAGAYPTEETTGVTEEFLTEEAEGAVETEAGSEETETAEQADTAVISEETETAEQADAAEVFEEAETAEQSDTAVISEET